MAQNITEYLILDIYRTRNTSSHKGDFGKSCIVAGSAGKMGAAVLATRAAMRAGSGITFAMAPDCGRDVLQNSCPEAMFLSTGKDFIEKITVDEGYTYGIGPGIGQEKSTAEALVEFLKSWQNPVVLDADALNILSGNAEAQRSIPENSIITPHPKEFERLFGKTEDENEQQRLAKEKSEKLGIHIVLKGHNTHVFSPEGAVFSNTTGNAGMAKGGSGDVLTGIITALLAQKYAPADAAVFGVWLHGAAGDLAAQKYSAEAMLPSDLISEIGNVFLRLSYLMGRGLA